MITIPNIINPNNDWCAYWEDFLTEDEMNYLINHPYWNNVQQGLVGGQQGTKELDIRTAECADLLFDEENAKLYQKLAQVIARVNATYFQAEISEIVEPLQFIYYNGETKGHYVWHTDMSPADMWNPRKIAMVLMLSDPEKDFEGGKLEMLVGKDPIELEHKKGRAWFFPSYLLHRVTPVTKGERKVAIIWVHGSQWK